MDIREKMHGMEVNKQLTFEGGDVLVLNKSVLIVGIGSRTTTYAVDALISSIADSLPLKYVLVQELPEKPESFIHLDMVFTLLSRNECMLYKPLIIDDTKYHTVLMTLEGKKAVRIEYIDNLVKGLSKISYPFKPIECGGKITRAQEREQWHSGANLFAFSPGKAIAYKRNIYTLEELNRKGYNIITADEFDTHHYKPDSEEKLVVTIEGGELARGGGGARCMTLPLRRSTF
jgi:arginine deiminase